MKITFDTNVLLSSTLWYGSVAHKLLFKLINSNAVIYSSMDILGEYNKILKRDFDYSEKEATIATESIFTFVNIVIPEQKLDIIKEDPDDNIILECAIASSSDYILTYDNHLLNLKEFRGIKIIKPEELIRKL